MITEGQLDYPARRLFVLALFAAAAVVLSWQLVELHVYRKDFLQYQGDARHLRVVNIATHRGMILDRNGEALALSTPVDSLWANPREIMMDSAQRTALARLLKVDIDHLQRLLASRKAREFVYLKRHVHPEIAHKAMKLAIPGLSLQREYRRYYPTGEVTAHVIGFTDIDDAGQEGIELAFDEWLRSNPGTKRVIKDRLGHIVENVESIKPAVPGKNLQLSIDMRLQYSAYRTLKEAVHNNKARSGSLVLLDVSTGEVLAMVNQPAYNPNNRKEFHSARYRNRAAIDVFEPGSTVKPFTVAAALLSGKYRPDTRIDTSPGMYKVGSYTVQDVRNYGEIDVTRVIQKSSNVGISKIALSLDPEHLWETFSGFGFGVETGSGFPGESAGLLSEYRNWREIEQATLAFGYGISMTTLQLARAYMILAAGGKNVPVTFLKQDDKASTQYSDPVIGEDTARKIINMLEEAVSRDGTGALARVPGFRIAGKTGTVRKSRDGGYYEHKYVSLFAGMAPASNPRFVMAVMINEPTGAEYYGGKVAAPVFSHVMSDALRLMNITPDSLDSISNRYAGLDAAVPQVPEIAGAGKL
jgi:cell division protein FtsI (penicillin-binding protein 3)